MNNYKIKKFKKIQKNSKKNLIINLSKKRKFKNFINYLLKIKLHFINIFINLKI
jgi:hypothetical protein